MNTIFPVLQFDKESDSWSVNLGQIIGNKINSLTKKVEYYEVESEFLKKELFKERTALRFASDDEGLIFNKVYPGGYKLNVLGKCQASHITSLKEASKTTNLDYVRDVLAALIYQNSIMSERERYYSEQVEGLQVSLDDLNGHNEKMIDFVINLIAKCEDQNIHIPHTKKQMCDFLDSICNQAREALHGKPKE